MDRSASALFSSLSLALVVGMFLATVAFFVWSSDRGLDFTDEGYYLLASQFPGDVNVDTTMAHFYTAFLFRIAGHDVANFRIAGLLLLLVSAWVFSVGLCRLMPDLVEESECPWLEWFARACFICLGAMINYSWFMPTPSYNIVNVAAVTTCIGLLFLGLASLGGGEKIRPRAWAAMFGVGVSIAVSCFVKISSGAILCVMVAGTLVTWRALAFRTRVLSIAFVLLGMGVWTLVHFALIQSTHDFRTVLQAGVKLRFILFGPHWSFASSGYRDLVALAAFALTYFLKLQIALVLGFTALAILRRFRPVPLWAPEVYVGMILMLGLAISFHHGFHEGGMEKYFVIAKFFSAWLVLVASCLICSIVFAHGASGSIGSVSLEKIGISGLVLASAPLIGACGTGTGLHAGAGRYMAFWFGMLIGILLYLSRIYSSRWLEGLGMLMVGTLATSQIITGIATQPYRLNCGIFDQDTPTSVGHPISVLKLDSLTSRFVTELKRIMKDSGFQPGDDILAFSGIPGAVFAVGGRSPGAPWYNSGYDGAKEWIEAVLSTVPGERLRRSFVLEGCINKAQRPDNNSLGRGFPNDYRFCGSALRYNLWRPATLVEIVNVWRPASVMEGVPVHAVHPPNNPELPPFTKVIDYCAFGNGAFQGGSKWFRSPEAKKRIYVNDKSELEFHFNSKHGTRGGLTIDDYEPNTILILRFNAKSEKRKAVIRVYDIHATRCLSDVTIWPSKDFVPYWVTAWMPSSKGHTIKVEFAQADKREGDSLLVLKNFHALEHQPPQEVVKWMENR